MASYCAIKAFANYTLSLFFRDIDVVNQENIPKQGATIIYGNHNNQFVDGLLLIAIVKRAIRFIAAASSCKRPIVGRLIKMANAIPVQRPQDIAKKGKGVIRQVKDNTIFGFETEFTKINLGSMISINKGPQLRISQIINDFQMQTDSRHCQNQQGEFPYIITPKIQYNNLYSEVWKGLNEGDCIGIFPQGGSHDRLQLLPFKAGICIMALGAMEKYGIPVSIVPCGFNYYNPQNFRSKVILEFGPSYKVPIELVELYKRDKREAISILLNTLQSMLKNVTTSMKTFDELSTLFLCRQLYTVTSKKQLTIKQKLQLNRRFAKGFDILATRPQNQQYFEKLLKFNQFVKVYGLPIRKDFTGSHFLVDLLRFIVYLQKFIVRLCLSLPGVILIGPTTTLIAYLSQKQRIRCLNSSKVKKVANDVVGSYKILLSTFLFPLTAIINSSLVYAGLKKFTKFDKKKSLKICILFALLMPVYLLLFVKSYDSLGKSFLKLRYFFIRLFKRSVYKQFNSNKKRLSKKLLEIIQQQGHQVIQDLQFNRIIQRKQIQLSSSYLMHSQQIIKRQ